jgi:hypothetical protein
MKNFLKKQNFVRIFQTQIKYQKPQLFKKFFSTQLNETPTKFLSKEINFKTVINLHYNFYHILMKQFLNKKPKEIFEFVKTEMEKNTLLKPELITSFYLLSELHRTQNYEEYYEYFGIILDNGLINLESGFL